MNGIDKEVFSTIINGLYGISMISITIFTILSNQIKQKLLGIPYVSLERYKIYMLFLPLIILSIGVMPILIWPCYFLCKWYIFLLSLVIVTFLIVHSYLMLEPKYNEEKFKNTIIKKRFKSKKNKDISSIIKELEDLKTRYKDKNIDEENLHYSRNDIITIWKKYNEELFELDVSVTDFNSVMNIGFELFGNDMYKIDLYDKLEKYLYINYLIDNKLDSELAFMTIFDILHVNIISDKLNDIKYYRCIELWNKFLLFISSSIDLQAYLMNIIANNEWNKKDCKYLHVYIRLLINNRINLSTFNIKIPDKIQYIFDCYDDSNNFKEKFGINFENFVKTCFTIYRKE